jgi:hypothetical protein
VGHRERSGHRQFEDRRLGRRHVADAWVDRGYDRLELPGVIRFELARAEF